MLKQFDQRMVGDFVQKKGSLVIGTEGQKDLLRKAKKIRSADYIFRFEVKDGVAPEQSVSTRANWLFVLTNVAVYWHDEPFGASVANYPRVAIDFPYYCPSSPFGAPAEEIGSVPSNSMIAREGIEGHWNHFEEYKNLMYVLDQKFVINARVKAAAGDYLRGDVILSGLEFDITDEV